MMVASASSVTMIGVAPPAADVTAVKVVAPVPARVAVVVVVEYDNEDIFSRWLSLNITDKRREPVVEINAVTAALQTACIASNNRNY